MTWEPRGGGVLRPATMTETQVDIVTVGPQDAPAADANSPETAVLAQAYVAGEDRRNAVLDSMVRLYQEQTKLPLDRIRLVETYEPTPDGGMRVNFHLEAKPDENRTPAGILLP